LRERVLVAQLAPLEHVEQRIQVQVGDHAGAAAAAMPAVISA
jgi:hypothetical protein